VFLLAINFLSDTWNLSGVFILYYVQTGKQLISHKEITYFSAGIFRYYCLSGISLNRLSNTTVKAKRKVFGIQETEVKYESENSE
jgi:hypothetical protein